MSAPTQDHPPLPTAFIRKPALRVRARTMLVRLAPIVGAVLGFFAARHALLSGAPLGPTIAGCAITLLVVALWPGRR